MVNLGMVYPIALQTLHTLNNINDVWDTNPKTHDF